MKTIHTHLNSEQVLFTLRQIIFKVNFLGVFTVFFPFFKFEGGGGGGGDFVLEFQGDRVQHGKGGGRDSWGKYSDQSRKLANHISSIDRKQRDQTESGARL